MPQESQGNASRRTGLLVCLAFISLAVLLAFDPLPFHSPIALPAVVPAWATDTSTVRHPSTKPEYQAGVYTFRCSECHGLFPPPAQNTTRTVTQHQEVLLKHGINTWCLSCHHPTSRDAFVGDRGEEIPWDQPQLLCSKCHGPVYRDWQHGAHGRTNGSWDESSGKQTRRKCIECHDPHQPPFPPMHPAPGPNTLRMGPQGGPRDHEVRNPLTVYERLRAEGTPSGESEGGH